MLHRVNAVAPVGMLHILVPAHNEAGCVGQTVEGIIQSLIQEGVNHELVVVNSTDGTPAVLQELCACFPTVRSMDNLPPNGFGLAVRKGLSAYRGDAVALS